MTAGCGGIAAFAGPCGAEDCPSCFPLSWNRPVENPLDLGAGTVLACVDSTWFPVGTLFEDRKAFRQACMQVYGKTPNLTPLDGGGYDYAAMRWVLKLVDRPVPDDEPTEDGDQDEDDDEDLSAGDFDEVDLDPAAREFRNEACFDRYIDED